MSPDSSEGGARTTGRRPTAVNAAAAKLQVRKQDTTSVAAHTWATPYLVMGHRGKLRLVLVVQRCAFGCGRSHVHSAAVDFSGGWRKAGCGLGRYRVHTMASEDAA